MTLTREIRTTVDMCRHCFMCRHANPTFLVTKLDAHTPRGYALGLSRIDDGLVEWSDDLATKLFQSTLDGLCSELCVFDWREDLVVQAGRVAAVRAGFAPPAVVAAAERRMADGGALTADLPIAGDRLDRAGAEVLYLTGLDARTRAPGTIVATAALLDHLGLDWTALTVERDTGLDLWELGHPDEADAAAHRFQREVDRIGPRRIVTGSSRVVRALRGPLPDALGASVPVVHLSELLDERIDDLPGNDGKAVAYHDPCALGRQARVFDPPRTVIEHLTGSTPVEFLHSREIAECCGDGGLLPELDPELAARLASAQLDRLPRGVDTLVTACPGCRAQLGDAASSDGQGIEVIDISELAARRLGLD